MKNRTKYWMSIGALGLVLGAPLASAQTLRVQTQVAQLGGELRYGLFNSERSFEDQMPYVGLAMPVVEAVQTAVFVDVPAGVYGLAVFHDRNGNQVLDRNLFGIPTEPYGFSRNPNIGFKAPGFDAFAFTVGQADLTLTINLNGQ